MVLAELPAPCSAGPNDCLQLEQVRIDRAGRTMLTWRERAPSYATGSHLGLLASGGSTLRRGQISANVDFPFRVLAAAPNKYSVLLKEWVTWKGFAADFSTATSGAPVFSAPVSTALADEMVRNFTEMLSRDGADGDNELTTVAWRATTGPLDLGGGVTGHLTTPPSMPALSGQPIRNRFLTWWWSADAKPTIQWLGTTAEGQAFSTVWVLDGSGAYGGPVLWNDLPRPNLGDAPGCHVDSTGFPSLMGAGSTGHARVGWLEVNSARTGCDLRIEGQVLNRPTMHVRKAVTTDLWAISEQQTLGDSAAPTLVMVNNYSDVARLWTGPRPASDKPMSRLLGQASSVGSADWIAIAWQDCDSTAANATCTTYITKSQSIVGWDLKKTVLPMAAGSSAPTLSINYNGDAIVTWVEPSAACTTDATKKCAQLKAQRF